MKIFLINQWIVNNEVEAQIFKNVIRLHDENMELYLKHTKENAKTLRKILKTENLVATAIGNDGNVYIIEFDKKCNGDDDFADVKFCDVEKKCYIEVKDDTNN